ncbi:MAG: hypothetical protein J0665_19840 [Deltaproteobacteria bacterium]|nr:hypothetical protein [Deltaproteobacteria bacterium]
MNEGAAAGDVVSAKALNDRVRTREGKDFKNAESDNKPEPEPEPKPEQKEERGDLRSPCFGGGIEALENQDW